ncbi:MAG TPA: hypothetical protein VK700_21245 [Steroidobacteraceae bacterium]|jgi:hypothetical protein|nr:hypothetical protein [Steroidobacteraceae bacterium]
MKSNWLNRAVRDRAVLASMALAAVTIGGTGLPAAAEVPLRLPAVLTGLLNDFTPSSVNGTAIKGGPWEMHGRWRVEINEFTQTATFSAEMSMETGDFVNPSSTFDPGMLNSHTHHITMTDAKIVPGFAGCPSSLGPTPLTSTGFQIQGMAHVTGNGEPAPFEIPAGITNPTASQLIASPLTICITGGTRVEYSNITLQIGAPAATHFGPQAIHGVIVKCNALWGRESEDCTVPQAE